MVAQLHDGTVIGAISCRKEIYMNETRVYIMTLGILSVYRRSGLGKPGWWASLSEFVGTLDLTYIFTCFINFYFKIEANKLGSLLLTRILEACQDDLSIDHVCLHVHVSNEAAITFYQRIGFVVYRKEHDYYLKNPGVEPPDAYFLRFQLREEEVL